MNEYEQSRKIEAEHEAKRRAQIAYRDSFAQCNGAELKTNVATPSESEAPGRARGITLDNVEEAFQYHPWNPDQVEAGNIVREALVAAVKAILRVAPDSADRSAAIRKIREARMDVNSAITHYGRFYAMAWIRLSDDYCDHPKFDNLSDGAFRLWHQAIGFCRKYQTDGLIPLASLRKFKAYSPKRAGELQAPWTTGEEALWQSVEGFGVKVYNYLKWNPSKDEDNERREESKERMRQLREDRRRDVGEAPVCANAEQTTHDVPGVGMGTEIVLLERREETRDPFDDFWAVYPKKTGKDAARAAWKKRRISADLASTIIAALAWQKQQDTWLRDRGRFVPNPTTWINQGRWQDEPVTTPEISDSTLRMARATQEFLQS